ncbi:methyltransferase [Actinomadura cremea]|nr:methyltransferase [Actinomadura cremea]
MENVVNAHQSEAWNGYEGAHWAEHNDRYDAMNAGLNGPLFEAAPIGVRDRVLDVGCGAGKTARIAARIATEGRVTGIDLSKPMIDRAAAVAAEEGIGNVMFEQGDAQAHPFPAGHFDVVISRGGVMYFADPVAAFTNIAGALRPGGHLAFVVPKAEMPQDMKAVFAAMGRHVPRRPDPAGADAPNPRSLGDPGYVHEVLGAAGFRDVTLTPAVVPMVQGVDADDAAEFMFEMGAIRFQFEGAPESTVEAARADVAKALAAYEGPDGVVLRADVWAVAGVRR